MTVLAQHAHDIDILVKQLTENSNNKLTAILTH